MPEKDGKIRICNRCGSAIFLTKTGENQMDGGFTVIELYEKAEGWKLHTDTGWLCSECEEKYQELIDDFKDNYEHYTTIFPTEKEFYNFKEVEK